MKILQIHTLYHPYVIGGAEVIVRNLANLLNKSNENIILTTHNENKLLLDYVDDIKVYRAPIKNIYWQYTKEKYSFFKRLIWHSFDMYNPLMPKYLDEVINIEKPDVAIIHNLPGFSVSIYDKLKSFNIPFIQVLHDQYFLCIRSTMFDGKKNCQKQCLQCKIMRRLHKNKSNLPYAVVGVSKFILDKHLKYGYFNKVPIKKVIYNSRKFDKNFELNFSRKNDENIRLGFIGNLAPNKGIGLLLKAFIELNNDKLKLYIAGSGKQEYENYLKTKYQNKNIEFLGRVDPYQFFPKIDITVVPSFWEDTLPGVVFESFYFGVPVIGSNLGGIPEMIKEGINGMLFNPYKPDDLKEKILSFVENIEYWRSKSYGIRETGKDFFDTNRWLNNWTELINEVIRRYKNV